MRMGAASWGKGEGMKDAVDQRSLKRVRELAWSLRDELHRISTELPLTMAPKKCRLGGAPANVPPAIRRVARPPARRQELN